MATHWRRFILYIKRQTGVLVVHRVRLRMLVCSIFARMESMSLLGNASLFTVSLFYIFATSWCHVDSETDLIMLL